MSSSAMRLGRSAPASFGPWLALWTLAGLLAALHHRTFHELGWDIALWWGLKDWYLWGLLSIGLVEVARRRPVTETPWLSAVSLHLVLAIVLAVVHSTLAVSLSYAAEYQGDLLWSDAVWGHILKRAPLNLAVYFAIIAFAEARRRTGGTGEQPSARARTSVERLLLRERDRERFLNVDRIIRLEAEGNYVSIHTPEGAHLERRTLKSLEELLPEGRFLRIHRSHVVNVDHIERMETGLQGAREVVLGDGTRLPMGRTFRKKLERLIGERF